MVPSVGRIVHYTMVGTCAGEPVEGPMAAIVTGAKRKSEVLGSRQEHEYIVDLHIFYRMGQFDSPDVPFSETYEPGHWTWPPKV